MIFQNKKIPSGTWTHPPTSIVIGFLEFFVLAKPLICLSQLCDKLMWISICTAHLSYPFPCDISVYLTIISECYVWQYCFYPIIKWRIFHEEFSYFLITECPKLYKQPKINVCVLRLIAGAKEIDIAATLEHIRDQRMLMVKTKVRFPFV